MHFSRFFQIIYFQAILTIGAMGQVEKMFFANYVVYLALPFFLGSIAFEQLSNIVI